MRITVIDIQNIFDKYNELCFDGKLPMPRIRIGHAKNYLGQLRYKVKKDKDGKRTYYDFSLNFSKLYEMDQQKLEDVVIHEMIHYYIHYHQIQDTSAHGAVFRKMMNDINTRFQRNGIYDLALGTICYPAGYLDLKPEDITEILKESM